MPAIVGPTLVAAAYAVGDLYASVPDDGLGPARACAATAACSPSSRSGATTCTTSSTTSTTSRRWRDRATVGAYDAYADDYAAGTSAMPDGGRRRLDALRRRASAPGARVLEIGSGPGRDARAARGASGSSVRRTDITPGVRRAAPRAAGYDADLLDPLTDDLADPLRAGTPYDGVWANASPAPRRAARTCRSCCAGSPRSPAPGGACT